MKQRFFSTPMAAVMALTSTAVALPSATYADTTGNISIVSKYVLRGMTNATETSGPALQGGFDWTGAGGFYLGYWGSNLSYASSPGVSSGFENDFYGGYAGKAGAASFSVGLIQYYYNDIKDSNGLEFVGTLGFGPVTGGFKYLTKDVAWGNKGDIYWTLAYGTKLPSDFSFSATLGYYTYKEEGKFISSSAEDSAFRHLDLGISHPIGKTGADMMITYTIGGKMRDGSNQTNAVVFGVKYGFDV